MWEVDSVITNELPEHPNNVDDLKALASLIREYVASYDVPNPAVIHS